MFIRPIQAGDRLKINRFLIEQWYATEIILRGERVDISDAHGWAAWDKEDELIGLITFRNLHGECEILSLDSLQENHGIGTALVSKVIDYARTVGCHQIKLITTNDNIRAIRFYQKRGFDMAKLYHNAMEETRKLKPEVPLLGMHGIPLNHEIEFVMEL